MGLPRENITLVDLQGVVYVGRKDDMNEYKSRYAIETKHRDLDDVMVEADVFLGLSAPNILSGEAIQKMAASPLILALANPTPEIAPELVQEVRPDAIMATGRSD